MRQNTKTKDSHSITQNTKTKDSPIDLFISCGIQQFFESNYLLRDCKMLPVHGKVQKHKTMFFIQSLMFVVCKMM